MSEKLYSQGEEKFSLFLKFTFSFVNKIPIIKNQMLKANL